MNEIRLSRRDFVDFTLKGIGLVCLIGGGAYALKNAQLDTHRLPKKDVGQINATPTTSLIITNIPNHPLENPDQHAYAKVMLKNGEESRLVYDSNKGIGREAIKADLISLTFLRDLVEEAKTDKKPLEIFGLTDRRTIRPFQVDYKGESVSFIANGEHYHPNAKISFF